MKKYSADYIFTGKGDPIKEGIVTLDDNGEILDVTYPGEKEFENSDIHRMSGVICPGFINAHCHLELSYLYNSIEKHTGLNGFITQLENIRKKPDPDIISDSIEKADQTMFKNGIVAVGDICNTANTFDVKQKSGLYYHNFIETFSSNPDLADKAFNRSLKLYNEIIKYPRNNSASITPHAPYSLSKKLFNLIKKHAAQNNSILSIHHQESEDENAFFTTGAGTVKDRHLRFGVQKSDFEHCGFSPLEAISDYLPKRNPFLFVHNTVSTQTDIEYASRLFQDITWCFCPNANLYIENKLPNIPLFVKNNCRIAIGTDSFASNETLSVLEEMKTILSHFQELKFETVLKWATLNGAIFLGIDETFGSIAKGKSPGLNLITDFDFEKMAPTSISRVTRIS